MLKLRMNTVKRKKKIHPKFQRYQHWSGLVKMDRRKRAIMLIDIAQWMLAPIYKGQLSEARVPYLWTKLISAILHHALGDGNQFSVEIFSREI